MEKGHQAKYGRNVMRKVEGERERKMQSSVSDSHFYIIIIWKLEKKLKNRILCPFISHVNVQTHASYVA